MSRIVFGINAEVPDPAASRRKHTAAERTPSNEPKLGNQSTTSNEEQKRKARKLENHARMWRKRNPDAWAFMVSLALRETKAKRRFGVKWMIEEARRKDFADVGGGRMKVSNSLATPLSRMLTEEHPETCPFVVQKSSIMDALANGEA